MNIFKFILPASIFIVAVFPLKLRADNAPSTAPMFQPRTGTFRLLEPDAAYKDFTGWVKARIDTSPKALLKRNRKLLKKEGKSTKRYDLILGGKLGHIRPMNRRNSCKLISRPGSQPPQISVQENKGR